MIAYFKTVFFFSQLGYIVFTTGYLMVSVYALRVNHDQKHSNQKKTLQLPIRLTQVALTSHLRSLAQQ